MWRVVDIAQNDRHLSLSKSAIRVQTDGMEVARIPIRDVHGVLVHGHGSTVSLSLLAALAEQNIPVVLCGSNHVASSILMPVSGNYEQAGRIQAQASASVPLKKRLWKQVTQQKIRAQADGLAEIESPHQTRLIQLAKTVRSGDPENIEAQAARVYWPGLLGKDFRRDRDADGINAALNYGYAVLRAGMSRAVVSVGLSPSLGLHHRSRLNAFQLVDDLMEPFRPMVDAMIRENRETFADPLTPSTKAELAGVGNLALRTDAGAVPVNKAMVLYALSLADIFQGKATTLWTPLTWTTARQEAFEFEV